MLFSYELTGVSPLLMHADDVDLADRLIEWRKDPKNKGVSKPGDDRTPAWTWQTYLYSNGTHVAIPTDNLSAALRQAGGMMSLKGKKSFKEASQCGLVLREDFLPLVVDGETIPVSGIHEIEGLAFNEQCEAVKKLGFELFTKRVKVGSAKHIRVRPRFNSWSVSGTVEVIAPEITEPDLRTLFDLAGFYKGIGDWRPKIRIQYGRQSPLPRTP